MTQGAVLTGHRINLDATKYLEISFLLYPQREHIEYHIVPYKLSKDASFSLSSDCKEGSYRLVLQCTCSRQLQVLR